MRLGRVGPKTVHIGYFSTTNIPSPAPLPRHVMGMQRTEECREPGPRACQPLASHFLSH